MKKIFFMGANRLGILCLEELLKYKDVDICGVLPRFSDRKQNIGQGQWNASVRKYAEKKDIKIYNFKTANEPKFRNILFSLKPDYILSVQYDIILKQEILKVPKIGSVNIHFAPLPRYRGCFPISWAIIDGNPAGVTMHWIDKGIDTGKIIDMREIPIKASDTARSIYDKATAKGFKIFKEVFPKVLERNMPGDIQHGKESIYHPKGYPYDRWIDWRWPAKQIDRFIRALTFPPYPSARTKYKNKEFEIIYPIKILSTKHKNKYQAGQIMALRNNTLTIASDKEFISAEKLRLDGNKIMKVNQFLKQISLKEGDIFE